MHLEASAFRSKIFMALLGVDKVLSFDVEIKRDAYRRVKHLRETVPSFGRFAPEINFLLLKV